MNFMKKEQEKVKERKEETMKLKMYSIKDELNGYTTPIPIPSDDVARRYFKEQIMTNPTIKNSKEDFSIWRMGTFYPETGHYDDEAPVLLERAKNYE